MLSKHTRRTLFLLSLGVIGVGWLAMFPLQSGDLEADDLLFSGLGLLFAGLTALLVFRVDLPVLELGWSVFTYGEFFRLLDSVAEGPEALETTVPGSFRLVGLGIIFVGFTRATSRLQADVDERNQRLAVLNRMLRHNLRNGLTPIISSLQSARENLSGEPERQQAALSLKKARSLADRSEKIRTVDEILERADREGAIDQDLADLVSRTVDDLREEFPDVEIDLSTEPVTVRAIPGLDSAVRNVVENACEHNDQDEPHVEVSVGIDGQSGVLTVADNGSGIHEEELRPIREGEESALSHGSGIGLWLVLWVVEKSGGSVGFEYDGGQIVRLRLPTVGSQSGILNRLRSIM